MVILQAENLTKQYGKKQALCQVNLNIEENKLVGVVGRNGSGKTTLLSLAAGFLRPTEGRVLVSGENPAASPRAAALKIFVDDKLRFAPNLNLHQCLEQTAVFYPNFQLKLAENMLRYFSLEPTAYPGRLSKGMKSTFFAIAGLCARAPLTIMDEPTTGMDSTIRRDFYKLLLKDYLQFPRTVLLSSHLLGEFEDILEEIVVLDQGRLLLHQDMDSFRQYAVGVRGPRAVLESSPLWKHKLWLETTGEGAFLICPAQQANPLRQDLAHQGCAFEQVTADQLYSCLAAKNKGGLEDVYQI